MEIDRRDGGDCVNAEAFGVPRQLAAVGGVVTGDVRDDDELAANSVHNGFEDGLAFFLHFGRCIHQRNHQHKDLLRLWQAGT